MRGAAVSGSCKLVYEMGEGDRADLAAAGDRPVVLFVLGFGRSGSSALARVLSLCGAALPTGLLGSTADNPRGFWEPRAVIHLNQAIMWRLGSSGYDPSLSVRQHGVVDAKEKGEWIARIRQYLHSLPSAPLILIKEPKTTALCGIWFEATRQAGFDVAAVIAVRHPEEVIGSLAERARRQKYLRASPELTSALWLKYNLLAERATRGAPRVFVEYSNLLEDWRREVKRVSTTLALDLNTCDEGEVDHFLTEDLWHHRNRGPIREPFGTDWIGTLYEAVHAAARDERWDASELDRVFNAYEVGVQGFWAAFEDYQRYRRFNRLMSPFIVKLSLGVLALVHRHRGTWA